MAAETSTAGEFSFALPRSIDTRIFIRARAQAKVILLSLTTATVDDAGSARPMGSFVYALPNRFDTSQPLATTLFSSPQTVEFAARMAKLLARKFTMPVYVTNSISLSDAPLGGTVEEEMEVFRTIVDAVAAWVRDEKLDFSQSPPTGV